MRIASWNVNSVRTRLDQVLAWLEQERPEVLCLQETKVEDGRFPHEAFQGLGYDCAISGQKAYNGFAIVSRLPLEDVQTGFDALLPDDAEARELSEQKRVISAVVDGIRVLNLYVPNGSAVGSDKYAYKLRWLTTLRRYLQIQEEQGDPLCMLGDFNIGPEDRDLPDPARQSGGIMASELERSALTSVLGERLSDVFRVFEADSGHWSWWDYRNGAWDRDRGWRIDHIYLCEELLSCATGCVIDRQPRGNPQPSDHAPVVVRLAWPPEDDGDPHEADEEHAESWSAA
ncbi:MAG: exodeoxyribonuclease III [Vulcanococcus sp.]